MPSSDADTSADTDTGADTGDSAGAADASSPAAGGRRGQAALAGDAAALLARLRATLRAPLAEPLVVAPSPTVRPAAVLLPLYTLHGLPHLLFTRRATSLARHSGEISFPGGASEPPDLSLAATAVRETFEELALDPRRIEVLGQMAPVHSVVSNYWVTPFVGWLGEGALAPRPNHAEVAEVIEAPLPALADPTIFHTERWRRAGVERTIYFYDLGPHRIWGLTGYIVGQFLALLDDE